MKINFKLIDNVVVDGIDMEDYPDFRDAFICKANYKGQPMSTDMLEFINSKHKNFLLESVYAYLFC